MKCKICGQTAVVALKSHNAGFCEDCFLKYFRRQIVKGIERERLFDKSEKILVALSGGKDSLSLALELQELGYNVAGVFIDLAIPGSSDKSREVVENFCRDKNLGLHIVDLAAEGLPMPLIKKHVFRPICSVCGKIKRYYLNRTAVENGYQVLATGHNLDDETARLFSNVLRWDQDYLREQGPCLPAETGFARKVKPLWRLTEFETANYAFIRKLPHHVAGCPYSKGASFTSLKMIMHNLENCMPGKKMDFYHGFLTHGKKMFQNRREADKEQPAMCPQCGFPSYGGEICGICRMKENLRPFRDETA